MSKKETEYDRFDRMKRLEKELEIQKKKSSETIEFDFESRKKGKSKLSSKSKQKNCSNLYDEDMDYELVGQG